MATKRRRVPQTCAEALFNVRDNPLAGFCFSVIATFFILILPIIFLLTGSPGAAIVEFLIACVALYLLVRHSEAATRYL
ncbi:hypothetical protein SAMN05892883_2862 [Jatrophihabitans sp. GAS493]|uniref:hypothetical protein n=1 Tax=Jatrophihabitans sp. GAS493 TaxID=1907575 RepID=UPI000BB6A34E|nr:hypothetical protein [Jatrophihabitans sp. GAS493]SOD73568.1 hypothetical protein SAMN05892883_2862 [Jatrophihabitans sp. GAS493]